MKSLNSIKYILLALIVFGFFANFAQNDYGFDLVLFCLFGLIMIFITEIIHYAKKELPRLPKGKKKMKLIMIMIILIILCFLTMIYIDDGSNPVFITAASILISSVLVLIILLSLNKPLLLESISLLLLSLGATSKGFHLMGAGIILIVSCFSITGNYIAQGYIIFKLIEKPNLSLANWILCFFLIIIFTVIAFMFKMMHWPGAGSMNILISALYLLFITRVIIRKKFSYYEQKVTLWSQIVKIKGNILLLFIFFTLGAIWGLGSIIKVFPGIYSDSKPKAVQKLVEEEKWKQYNIYLDNFFAFFENREKTVDN